MNRFERGLARAWPMVHKLRLGGLLGPIVTAWPGLDFWSEGDLASRQALHEALLADSPKGWWGRAARARLLFGLASISSKQRDYPQAVDLTQQALRQCEQMHDHAHVAACYLRLGLNHVALGRYEEGLAAVQRSLEISPRSRGVHTILGHILAALHRYEEALAAYQQAIELHPQDAQPHEGVGDIYMVLGRYADAVVAYQWSIEAEPGHTRPYIGLGKALHFLKRYDEAKAAYQRAIELDPQDATPYEGLGHLCASLTQYELAVDWYHKAIEKEANPRNQAMLRSKIEEVQQALGQSQEKIDAHPQ